MIYSTLLLHIFDFVAPRVFILRTNLKQKSYSVIYILLDEVPGVARGIKKNRFLKENNFEKGKEMSKFI